MRRSCADRPTARPAVVLLPFSGERAFAEAGELDGALHRVLALDGAGVGGGDLVALDVGREREADGLTFDGPRDIGLSELTGVVTGQLFAVLLEGKVRRPRTGGRLDRERPLASHVDFGGGPRPPPGRGDPWNPQSPRPA